MPNLKTHQSAEGRVGVSLANVGPESAKDPRRLSRASLVSQRLNDAHNAFMRRVFAARCAAHPILGDIAIEMTEHGGPIRNVVSDSDPVDSPMITAVAEVSFAIGDIEKPNFPAYKQFVDDIVEQFMGAQLTHMFKTMGQIATAVGNVPDGDGELTLETFREGIRKIELDWDDAGRAKIPQLIVHPDHAERAQEVIAQAERDPELVRIVAEKRAAFLARQRKRRLY